MNIPTTKLTLDIETALGPAGLRILAAELLALAADHPSMQHAGTIESMAAQLLDAADIVTRHDKRAKRSTVER